MRDPDEFCGLDLHTFREELMKAASAVENLTPLDVEARPGFTLPKSTEEALSRVDVMVRAAFKLLDDANGMVDSEYRKWK